MDFVDEDFEEEKATSIKAIEYYVVLNLRNSLHPKLDAP